MNYHTRVITLLTTLKQALLLPRPLFSIGGEKKKQLEFE